MSPLFCHTFIKSNHQKVNTVQLYCLLFIIEWWLDLILYTSYRPTQLIINQWESSMMKSSTNEREAWWNHQPMREQHLEIISQWESSIWPFLTLQLSLLTIPSSTPFINHLTLSYPSIIPSIFQTFQSHSFATVGFSGLVL